jgi:hypothetical protein
MSESEAMRKLESPETVGEAMSPASIQQLNAVANVTRILRVWCAIFSIGALCQIVLWPTPENIASVLLAWMSCILTGAVMMRGRMTFLYPWSSLIVITFCLTTCALPLVLMLLQGDPLTSNLEVPVATFSHLLICHVVLLAIHVGYRSAGIWRRCVNWFRARVLWPAGFLDSPSWTETLCIGGAGLLCTAYIYIVLRDQNLGVLSVTGSAVDKFAQGLCPLTFAPFLFLFALTDGRSRNQQIFRLAVVIAYFIPVLFMGLAYNTREFIFTGFAIIGIYFILLLLSGRVRLKYNRLFVVGTVGLLFVVTVGSDVAIAMRIARDDVLKASSMDVVKETFDLLTAKRDELKIQRDLMRRGTDETEAWYVTSPVFSRLIYTQFQDRALAIGRDLSDGAKQTLRQVEIEHIETALPNPVLNLIGLNLDKNQANNGGSSVGAWMLYLGGSVGVNGWNKVFMDDNGNLIGELYASGGFIGDGFAAYGWGYLLPFGAAAMVLFLFADSLYGFMGDRTRENLGGMSVFAMVGLINGYALATSLAAESIARLIHVVLRMPLQWLTVYGVVFWAVRFATRMLFGARTNATRPGSVTSPRL